MLGYILIAVLVVSLISLIGVAFFWLNQKLIDQVIPWLVAFAAGVLIATAAFDLIPESLAVLPHRTMFVWLSVGILLFLFLEQVLHWHHEHHSECDDCDYRPKAVGYSILLGAGLHNFLDGVLIVSAFLSDVRIGMAATIAVILHEIPHELGDFAVLLHSGFTKKRALYFNFLSALTAIAGGLIAYFALEHLEIAVPYLVAVGAGGFLYIALADLFAELKGGKHLMPRIGQLIVLILGMMLIYYLV